MGFNGTVFSVKIRSPVTEIKRIEGSVFVSNDEAIQHGLELAKQWVDEQGIGKDKMFHACDMQSGVFPVTRRALF